MITANGCAGLKQRKPKLDTCREKFATFEAALGRKMLKVSDRSASVDDENVVELCIYISAEESLPISVSASWRDRRGLCQDCGVHLNDTSPARQPYDKDRSVSAS